MGEAKSREVNDREQIPRLAPTRTSQTQRRRFTEPAPVTGKLKAHAVQTVIRLLPLQWSFTPPTSCYNAFMKPSEALAAHRAELRELVSRHGLMRPRVFGSVLSGADTGESDLDLLVDATETTTLFKLASLEHAAQELLGVPVSVLAPGFLPTNFRSRVLELAEPL